MFYEPVVDGVALTTRSSTRLSLATTSKEQERWVSLSSGQLSFCYWLHSLSPLAAQSRRDVDEIIQKAINSMGGLERIHALHSLVFRGFHYEGSYKQEYSGSKTSNATLIRMRPSLRLVGCRPEIPMCNGQWSDIVEAFDGQHGWELNWPKQRLVKTRQ